MRKLILFFIGFLICCHSLEALLHATPVSYQGRFRPLEAYARLTLNNFENPVFEDHSPTTQIWLKHFLDKELPTSFFHSEALYEKTMKKFQESNFLQKEIAGMLDRQFPLQQRLINAGQDLQMLPSKNKAGEWVSLRALNLKIYDPHTKQLNPIKNFTVYSDKAFEHFQTLYWQLEQAIRKGKWETTQLLMTQLSLTLWDSYRNIAGKPYVEAHGKVLYYPTIGQLKAETLYYQYPLIGICMTLYLVTAVWVILKPSHFRIILSLLTFAFLFHTLVLGLRIYILGRPPVSNMFETVIYVPWITVLVSMAFAYFMKNSLIIIAASVSASILLAVLKITHLNSHLENVQAVLDSQFWLLIHVLMVVGSYGFYLLSGVLGHLYLFFAQKDRKDEGKLSSLATMILQSMYLGTALLIPGTILGGVWAAESWGRFWDWDPKESWAFISSCVYLMWIHAFRFKHIGDFGLAIGSIIGLQAIIFTWYGVNYILGTGLHSYGFGDGGEIYYYFFFIADILFVATMITLKYLRACSKSSIG